MKIGKYMAVKSNDTEAKKKRPSKLVELFVRLVREKPMGTAGAIITVVLLLIGIFANYLAPYGVNDVHSTSALLAPSFKFLMGTDNLGRDVLSRVIFGARISVIVGLTATLIATSLSSLIGILSAYSGGTVDLIVQRFVDAVMCIPALIILMLVISIIGTGMWQVIICLGIIDGIAGTRMIRSLVINIKEDMYIQSATAIGAPTRHIIFQHILPNIWSGIIIIFSTTVPSVILAEAGLSFLGFGIPPPAPSWGGMLGGSAQRYMYQAPWMAFWPGFALALMVFGVSMFGDALRDLLDPRLRGSVGRYGSKNIPKVLTHD